MSKIPTIALTIALALGLASRASASESVAAAPPKEPAPKPWGVEVELVQPFIPEVHIFTLKASRTLWGDAGKARGEALLGVYLRPSVAHDVVDEINEYTAILGYRQYAWRGLHAELLTYVGWAEGLRNKKDGKDYRNVAWLGEVSLGYRFTLVDTESFGLHVTPQLGYLAGIFTDIGPRDTPDRFVTGKLLVGAQF